MSKARVALFYGMGGAGIERWETGLRLLRTRFHMKDVDCELFDWDQRGEAYNYMHNFTGWRGYFGASLGAGSAAQYPGDVRTPVNQAGGFQPSMFDQRAVTIHFNAPRVIYVAPNLVRAHAIYDPHWLQTGGLGYATYAKSPGTNTIVLNTAHEGAHPDDWGFSQDLLFNAAMAEIGALP